MVRVLFFFSSKNSMLSKLVEQTARQKTEQAINTYCWVLNLLHRNYHINVETPTHATLQNYFMPSPFWIVQKCLHRGQYIAVMQFYICMILVNIDDGRITHARCYRNLAVSSFWSCSETFKSRKLEMAWRSPKVKTCEQLKLQLGVLRWVLTFIWAVQVTERNVGAVCLLERHAGGCGAWAHRSLKMK